jgi:hypothetical protein
MAEVGLEFAQHLLELLAAAAIQPGYHLSFLERKITCQHGDFVCKMFPKQNPLNRPFPRNFCLFQFRIALRLQL